MNNLRSVLVLCLLSLLLGGSVNAQWVQTNGPYGGEIGCFAVSPNGAGGTNLFAGTHVGGVFLSTNNGTSWTEVNNGLTNTSVFALEVSPASDGTDSTNLFAGTNGGGVFLSTNNGTSWTEVNNGLTNGGMMSFAMTPKGAGGTNLFAAGPYDGGVFLSTNNGTSWTEVNNGLTDHGVNALGVSGTNLFAGTVTGVFRSTDNGTNWTSANTGLPTFCNFSDFVASPNGTGGTNLFAGTLGNGVFLSTNNGTSWSAVNSGLPANDYVHTLALSGTNLFAGTYGSGVFLSTNNGTNWTAVNIGLTNTLVKALAVSGSDLFAGTNNGVWRRPLSEMITSTIPATGLQMWLKADAGVDTLNGKVSRWHDQSGKGNDAIQFNTVRQPLFVGGELNQKPVLRFDGFDDKLGFTGTTPMSQFTLFMVVKNYSGGGEHNSHVITFGPFGGSPTQGFAVLWGGFDRVPDLILFGNLNGGMFASAPNIAANGEWRIISIVFQTRFNTTLRWNGNNATMSVNEPGPSFFGPMGDSTGSGGGIAGADGVPLLTAKCDFAEAIVYDTVLTDSQRLAIEQYLNGKYNIVTGVNEQQRNLPEKFVIDQNYPNPFNPSTTIRYGLPLRSQVTLTVFNTLGQRVATLVQGEQEAGNHEVHFNGAGLASGVYFYELRAGEFVQTRKLVLQK